MKIENSIPKSKIDMNKQKLKKYKQSGLTLVELLVASFLGLLLVGIIGSMYITSVGSFRSSNELSRVQENTRFTLNFLNRSFRQAGYSECGANLVREYSFLTDSNNSSFNGGLIGWEFAGTAFGETFDLDYTGYNPEATLAEIATARTNNKGVLGDWTSTASVNATSTSVLQDIVDSYDPIRGSDIFAVTFETERTDIAVTGVTDDTVEINPANSDLPGFSIVKVGDCYERNVFSKTNAAGVVGLSAATGSGNIGVALRPAGGNGFWSSLWGAEARVFTDTTEIYFVGTGSSGIPALFRVTSGCGFQLSDCEVTPTAVELVEGVESMQIMYGVDTDDDAVANQFFTAESVPNNFDEVVTVRLGLLMRANLPTDQTVVNDFTLTDGVIIDAMNDGALRYVINSTIELRNRVDQ